MACPPIIIARSMENNRKVASISLSSSAHTAEHLSASMLAPLHRSVLTFPLLFFVRQTLLIRIDNGDNCQAKIAFFVCDCKLIQRAVSTVMIGSEGDADDDIGAHHVAFGMWPRVGRAFSSMSTSRKITLEN